MKWWFCSLHDAIYKYRWRGPKGFVPGPVCGRLRRKEGQNASFTHTYVMHKFPEQDKVHLNWDYARKFFVSSIGIRIHDLLTWIFFPGHFLHLSLLSVWLYKQPILFGAKLRPQNTLTIELNKSFFDEKIRSPPTWWSIVAWKRLRCNFWSIFTSWFGRHF